MILTYKYRIKDRRVRKALQQHAWAVNQVWNYCVAYQRDIGQRYKAGAPKRRWPKYYDLVKMTSGTSKELGIHAQTIQLICQQFCENREIANYKIRFRSSGGPKRSLGWIPFQRQSRRIDGNSIIYRGKQYRFWEGRRTLPDSAKGGVFFEDARGRWYVCFHVDVEDRPTGNAKIGIDLGLKSMATCSDGATVEAPRIYRRYERRLACAQRARNRRRVSAIHAKIKNCRADFIHKATAKIARDNALIAIGAVSSSKLTKTRRFAKSTLDVGWSMFRSQLRYKASRHGAVYLDINERFTTQTCSQCGALPPERPKGIAGLGIRAWECSDCGASHDRDVNAARNILALALSAQRRGDESGEAAAMARTTRYARAIADTEKKEDTGRGVG